MIPAWSQELNESSEFRNISELSHQDFRILTPVPAAISCFKISLLYSSLPLRSGPHQLFFQLSAQQSLTLTECWCEKKCINWVALSFGFIRSYWQQPSGVTRASWAVEHKSVLLQTDRMSSELTLCNIKHYKVDREGQPANLTLYGNTFSEKAQTPKSIYKT